MKRANCVFTVYYPEVFHEKPDGFLSSNYCTSSSILTQCNLASYFIENMQSLRRDPASYYRHICPPAGIPVTYTPLLQRLEPPWWRPILHLLDTVLSLRTGHRRDALQRNDTRGRSTPGILQTTPNQVEQSSTGIDRHKHSSSIRSYRRKHKKTH